MFFLIEHGCAKMLIALHIKNSKWFMNPLLVLQNDPRIHLGWLQTTPATNSSFSPLENEAKLFFTPTVYITPDMEKLHEYDVNLRKANNQKSDLILWRDGRICGFTKGRFVFVLKPSLWTRSLTSATAVALTISWWKASRAVGASPVKQQSERLYVHDWANHASQSLRKCLRVDIKTFKNRKRLNVIFLIV